MVDFYACCLLGGEHRGTVMSAQYNRSNAIPNQCITLRTLFKRFGSTFNPAEVGPVEITKKDPRDPTYDEDEDLLETIPEAEVSNISTGVYQYQTSNTTIGEVGKYYDVVHFKFEMGGDTFMVVNDFNVTADGLPKLGYVTVEEMRAEGLGDEVKYPDSFVNQRIAYASRMIENYTGRWFEARQLTIDVDGHGGWQLQLPFPIVSIDEVSLLDREFPVTKVFTFDLDDLTIYNRHITQGLIEGSNDDREDPKLGNVYFPKGRLNVRLKGSFGYTDELGNTPTEIKRACMLMVIRDSEKLGSKKRQSVLLGGLAGPIKREVTDDHEYDLAIGNVMPGRTAFYTGDAEIDNLLLQFRRPISLGMGLGAPVAQNIDGGTEFDRFRSGFDFFFGRSL